MLNIQLNEKIIFIPPQNKRVISSNKGNKNNLYIIKNYNKLTIKVVNLVSQYMFCIKQLG